jgi:hypothetical protein
MRKKVRREATQVAIKNINNVQHLVINERWLKMICPFSFSDGKD